MATQKKAPTVIDDQNALVEAVIAELDVDRSLLHCEVNDIISRLRNGQALLWASGAKIPAGAVRQAFRDAKHRIETGELAEEDSSPMRSPTERAMRCGGPDFDPDKMSAVECKIKLLAMARRRSIVPQHLRSRLTTVQDRP